MSKEGEKAAVFQTTKVRTKLRGDGSWLQRRSEPTDENEEEKPWVAEVRNSRLNGAPTSPVTSPTKPTPPSPKPDTERAPTSGFLIRGIFTKLDKPAPTSNYNGFSGVNQYNKKPSEVYKKIAPHTVRPTPENKDGQLSTEEQEKRKEAASSILKKSSVKKRSYVLSAAKKFEAKVEEPETPSFVAKRVEIADDDESPASAAPASTLPAVPVTSVSSTPQAEPQKIADASVKTAADVAVKEPAVQKVEEKKDEVSPEPVKEDPSPAPVTVKDPFENMKPGCTKVDTPLPELITECIPAVSAKPEPEDSDVSGQVDKPLVDLAPALSTPMSPTPTSPAPASVVPESPAPVSLTPLSPATEQPAPVSPTPLSPTQLSPATKQSAPVPLTPLSPTPLSPTPLSPATKQSAPVPLTPLSPTPLSPTPLSPATKQPAPVSPTPLSPPTKQSAPVSLTPLSPAPLSPTPLSPTPLSPPTEQPAPVSLSPVSAVTEILVKTEPEAEAEAEPEPEPKTSSSVDTLTALSDTLISFDTGSPSFKDDEPALAAEEGGSADGRTTESGAEQEPAPELSNCVPMTDDLLVLTNGPEASAEPAPPPSPGRWSQDLLSGLDSELKPAKTSSALDFLANDVIPINTEARSLSMQREEEEQTDETAKETQSPTETVTLPAKTVIITDKSEEDRADPSSPRATTTVPESSSADPFDPYPIGTTSPNSSSDLLQPVSDISINSASLPSTESKDYQEPKTDTGSNALDSLADNIIPIDTDATSLSTLRPWARTWDTSTPEQSNAKESRDAEPEGQAEDQNMVIKFERKSKENDSPWDRWTSPTVYTIATEEEEEEEQQEEEQQEEESPEDTQTQTFPSFARIRESRSEPEPAMDRYEPYSRTVTEDDRRVETPEPDAKKGFVYVKEVVNATELSLLNARDTNDGLDYLTPSSTSYSYGSPSSYSSGSPSSNCTYCGRLMGNDAKITIDHLKINCHPECFKCGVCGKPMGDLLDSMFLHGGEVNCESCYSRVFE